MITYGVGDVVEVTWEDAFWEGGDSTRDEWGKTVVQHTFGCIVEQDPMFVRVAHEWDSCDTYRGVTTIPWSYVREVRTYGRTSTTVP